jgi:hypothetical protein
MPHYIKGKVDFTLDQATKAQRGVEVYLCSFFNLGARRGGWPTSRSDRITPGKTRYPLYRRLGGPQGRFERVREISPPPGFDPRTVQHVASRYTDWAIPVMPPNILDEYFKCEAPHGTVFSILLSLSPSVQTFSSAFCSNTPCICYSYKTCL